jgi:hypothetical protein
MKNKKGESRLLPAFLSRQHLLPGLARWPGTLHQVYNEQAFVWFTSIRHIYPVTAKDPAPWLYNIFAINLLPVPIMVLMFWPVLQKAIIA